MATNDDDLYGDLGDAVAKSMTPSNTTRRTTTTIANIHTSTTSTSLASAPPPRTITSQSEFSQLQKQVETLKGGNDILKKNIGILYRTSKSELERKDRIIDQLQNELDLLRR
mmetsp:Transcript_9887/g.18046  ORF Transcript_9887/g.18046 Transcript_9887/m.18046 type:complete len:112 (+) Transcript_9887:72-407(+)